MDISCHKSLKDSTTTCPILGCSTVHFIPGSSFFLESWIWELLLMCAEQDLQWTKIILTYINLILYI